VTKEEVLYNYWGFKEFRFQQANIIDTVLDGKDLIALLPTGGGKSVCYQIPSLMMEGICIVVSPLVSLIEDQVESLNSKGIKALGLSGGIPYQELERLLDNCVYGNFKFLYLSPERLAQPLVWERLLKMNINLIAIDEAHCISQWGHDFRPSYLNCSKLKEEFKVPVIALTATATKKVENEISELLLLENPQIYRQSFNRSNLSYQLIQTADKSNYLFQICKKHNGSGIVYANNRGLCKQLSELLNQQGIAAAAYHGGMSKDEKSKVLQSWKKDITKIVVATSAFGMGVDKADVQFIVHFQLTESMEQYVQETGRAGRNSQEASIYLLYHPSDEQKLKDQYLNSYPTIEELKEVYKHLNNFFSIAYGELPKQKFYIDLNTFCHRYQLNTNKTYTALKIFDKYEIIELEHSNTILTKIQFTAAKSAFENLISSNKTHASILTSILRTYGGVFELPTAVNLDLIAFNSNCSKEVLVKALNYYKQLNLLSLLELSSDLSFYYTKPREDHYTINQFGKLHQQSIAHKNNQLQACIEYTQLKQGCRMVYLLNYFGEKAEACGKCDLCKSTNNSITTKELKARILDLLSVKPHSSKELVVAIDYPENTIFEALKDLLATQNIRIDAINNYHRTGN